MNIAKPAEAAPKPIGLSICERQRALREAEVAVKRIRSSCARQRALRLSEAAALPPMDSTADSVGDDLRAVSVHHLSVVFRKAVLDAGLSPTARIYEIEPVVIRPRGGGVQCPRDNRPGAAYVDTVHGVDHVGIATCMLSYVWGYAIEDIVSSLEQFCDGNNKNPRRTYVWMCCLCINQHRVQEMRVLGQTVAFDEFRSCFSSRVTRIQHVLCLMSPWQNPLYMTRVWCVFEFFTASINGACQVDILMPPHEEASLSKAMQENSSTLNEVWHVLCNVSIEDAQASVEEDRANILRLIEDGLGYARLNLQVSQHLQAWFSETVARHTCRMLKEAMANSTLAIPASKLTCIASKMYRAMGKHDKAMCLLEEALQMANATEIQDTTAYASLISAKGTILRKQKDLKGALASYEKVLAIYDRLGMLDETEAGTLFMDIGTVERQQGDLCGALEHFLLAKNNFLRRGVLDSDVGANLLNNIGIVKVQALDLQGAADAFKEAYMVRNQLGILETPSGAELLSNIGELKLQNGDVEGALGSFYEARAIYERTGSLESNCAKDLEQRISRATSYDSYPSCPSYPSHPSYPSQSSYPSYPSHPSHPSYPSYPSRPSYP